MMDKEIALEEGLNVPENYRSHCLNNPLQHKHKREKNCDRWYSLYKRLFFGVCLAFILLFAGIGIASASETYAFVALGESIQDAIDSICPDGGIVELASGTYNVTTSIMTEPLGNGVGILVAGRNNITIKGQGMDSTIVQTDNTSLISFYVENSTNITIKDMKIYGNYVKAQNKYVCGIKLYGTVIDSNFLGLYIENFGAGFRTQYKYGNFDNLTIKNCQFIDNYNGGLWLSSTKNSLIENCTMAYATSWIGLDFNTNNQNNEVRNCTSYSNQYAGFRPGYSSNGGNVLENCLAYDNEYGFVMHGTIANEANTLRNCTARNNRNTGVYISNPYRDQIINIYNCLIYDNAEHGIGTHVWIASNEGTVYISETTIANNKGDGVYNIIAYDFHINNSIITNNGIYGITNTGVGSVTSVYNDNWNNGAGNYNGISAGTGDISSDPLFADPANDDFHLKSTGGRLSYSGWVIDNETSPCIDNGDPSSDYSNEPSPNGGRINMGAYGNTVEASKSLGDNTTPPFITAHSPTGTGVPIATTITATFSEAMNTSSAEGAFSISPSGSGSFSWNENMMIFTPDSNLDYETTYTINISTEAKDLAGNNLESPFSWQFTTATFGTDLVGMWHFDEGSGEITEDSSGNDNNGTLVNVPVWVDGKLGKALSFDGVDGYVDCGSDSSLNISGVNGITYEAWIYPHEWGGDGTIVRRGWGTDLDINNEVEFRWYLEGVGSVTKSVSGYSLNTWYHIAGTYDGSTINLYINGENVASVSATGVISPEDRSVFIGREPNSGDYFDGVIDEVKIYNRALTPDEIQANYESGSEDTASPTTTYTITPPPEEQGWNNVTPVVVTFFRSASNGSIVSHTNYSKISQTGPWTTVSTATATGPDAENVSDITEDIFNVTVSDEGVTIVWYYSVNNNSNVESAKNLIVKINTTTPPSTISNLQNTTGTTWINWTWNNPLDDDFSHTMLYLDGIWETNTSDAHYNATDLAAETSYELSTRTADTKGNVNNIWVNQTATTLAVPNSAPTAFIDSITPDPAEQGKDIVSFSGHGTDTDGSVVAYNWSSSIDGLLSTASSFSKPASELSAGTHTIYFKVQDDNGAWSTEVMEDLTIIEPANQPPVAVPNGPYAGTEGVPTTFDGSASYDPDGSIVAYEWDFGDGDAATGVNPTHTYSQNGSYTVTLTVTDNEGAAGTNTTTAIIADTEPTAEFSATPVSGPEPLTVAFTGVSTSYDGITAWAWDFDNDGVIDITAQNPTHVYAKDGVYTVSLTVREADGDSDTITKADYINVASVNLGPDITISSPENRTYASTSVRLDVAVQPEGTVLDWIAYRLDSGTNVTIPGNTTTINGIGAGDHTLVVYARGNGNMAASNTVIFTLQPGDINGDKVVNILDLQLAAWAFASQPGDTNWNEAADLNCDDKINIFDYQIVAWNLG